MRASVVKFNIENEMDIVLAHKRASQICDLTGIGISGRTSFVTAISEICRNCLEHANNGAIELSLNLDNINILEATITDSGPGIEDLETIMARPVVPSVKGCGLQYSKKLVDHFDIFTSPSGTTVRLGMKITSKAIPLSPIILKGWTQYFEKAVPVSPYEEIKKQNIQLLEIADQLRLKNLEATDQLEEIKSLNDRLNRVNKDLEDFAYSVSHDLKNPISNLTLLISLIEKTKSAEKKEEYIGEFRKLINRLNQMINGLVQIIELKNTKDNLAKVVPFDDILSVVRDELQEKLRESGGSIIENFSAAPVVIYYEVYLYSILSNLISNALKYRHIDRPPVIEVSTHRDSEFLILKVKDNGMGMDLEKTGKSLFKPFIRLTTEREGKGIGLHLVKSMIERNDGKIEVKSTTGNGTTFTVYLKEYKLF